MLNLSIQGFCEEKTMANYMQIADFMAIKAGGATIGECYATQTVPIIYQKLSGVESANVKHVQESGTGLVALTAEKFISTVQDLLNNKVDVANILAKQAQLKTRGSSLKIATQLIKMC
jgi:UDP-N-acetylglucosamine:LPS N-acetylglucosamine transferase